MFYNYYHADDREYNECNARGACSIAPKISSLQEVLVIFLKQLSYYSLKLESLNQDISLQSDKIVTGLASIISTTDYSDEQLLDLVSMYYGLLVKTKREYQDICKKNNIQCSELKFGLKITPQMNLSGIIAQGERIFLEKYKKLPVSQKNMTEILLFTLKSVCINLLDLKNCGKKDDDSARIILSGLDTLNSPRVHIPVIKEKIKELVDVNDRLLDTISSVQTENFGEIKRKSVSLSTSSGKAILVSGGSMPDLMTLLEQVENDDIDIYTHGDLLIAHAFQKFAQNSRLKGHYGSCNENCILDFATFPGAILLTRNSYQNVEYLYRGRLFTTEDIQPSGVIKIENNDFTKLIESAEKAKGFAKGRTYPDMIIGYDSGMLKKQFELLGEKYNNNEVKKIIILGHTAKNTKQNDYFTKFLKLLPEDYAVISFSYNCEKKNCITLNLVNNLPAIYSVLKLLFTTIPIDSERLAFFIAKCDVISISHMIALKNHGAKNIFLSNCQPKINPSISATLRSVYGIKSLTQPEDDIKLL